MDRSIQVAAFLRKANADANPKGWLTKLHDEALAAVMEGDAEITTTSYEGGSDSGSRKFNAQDLLEVTELALQQLEGSFDSRLVYTDFSSSGRTVQT